MPVAASAAGADLGGRSVAAAQVVCRAKGTAKAVYLAPLERQQLSTLRRLAWFERQLVTLRMLPGSLRPWPPPGRSRP
jgi:hypothetical protein